MLLTPRYGDRPVISVEVRADGPHPVVAQRARLEGLLRELSDDEWQEPSRCAGWTVQDVVTHLSSTNGYWTLSIQAGLAGEPTRYMGAFDPVATPAQLVDQVRGTPVADTLAEFASSNAVLTTVVEGLGDADWDKPAEAPPGHLPIWLVADHALWDAWVHERDILLPLDRTPVVDGDEVLTSLRYGAALGRAFEVCRGEPEEAAVVLEVADPQARVVVAVEGDGVRIHDGPAPDGAAHARGDAVDILEMVSLRREDEALPGAIRTLTAGLAVTFDQSSAV